jgi:tryptophan synthase beta chain
MAPHLCALYDNGNIEAIALDQLATFEGAVTFARTEGILPAPESSHAVRAAIDEAVKCREEGTSKVIAFNLSGHGHFDLAAYDEYQKGNLVEYAYPEEKIRESLAHLPEVNLG